MRQVGEERFDEEPDTDARHDLYSCPGNIPTTPALNHRTRDLLPGVADAPSERPHIGHCAPPTLSPARSLVNAPPLDVPCREPPPPLTPLCHPPPSVTEPAIARSATQPTPLPPLSHPPSPHPPVPVDGGRSTVKQSQPPLRHFPHTTNTQPTLTFGVMLRPQSIGLPDVFRGARGREVVSFEDEPPLSLAVPAGKEVSVHVLELGIVGSLFLQL